MGLPKLPNSLRAWPSPSFAVALKSELEGLAPGALPLDRAACHGGRVDDGRITATVLRSDDDGVAVRAEVGVFFSEIVAGCSCGDEPQALNGYCEMQVKIDKTTAAATFALLDG